MQPAAGSGAKADYWDRYYASSSHVPRRPLPSQFATFVAGELPEPYRVVEFGCGTGRDALFFASYGHQVIGIDGSASAIEQGVELANALEEKVDFIHAAIGTADLAGLVPVGGPHTLVYARFFLHAITEAEEAAFLGCAEDLTDRGDIMAVEYRTIRDSSGFKETDTHFRRFLNPADFQYAAGRHGFRVRYAAEGYGFAKYRQDDAYVARAILERL